MFVYSGSTFNLNDFSEYHFDVEEIAHSLSMLCRYNGHTKKFYSVAQHSVIVATSLPSSLRLFGLLHDAAEAYVGDVVCPLKKLPLMNYYKQLEDKILSAILFRHGVFWSEEAEEKVNAMDKAVLAVELNDLFDKKYLADCWHGQIIPLSQEKAKDLFLSTYKEVKCQR